MAYDVELADLLRARLSTEPDVTEKQMFGSLAFLVSGQLAVAVSGQGGLMLRVDPAQREALDADPRVGPMVMRGKPMAGWARVHVDGSVSVDELGGWVELGVAAVRSLPPR